METQKELKEKYPHEYRIAYEHCRRDVLELIKRIKEEKLMLSGPGPLLNKIIEMIDKGEK